MLFKMYVVVIVSPLTIPHHICANTISVHTTVQPQHAAVNFGVV